MSAHPASGETKPAVPVELRDALDPVWLRGALAPLSGGAAIGWVGDIVNFETVAAKVRFGVRFVDDPDTVHRFCLKAMLGAELARAAGATALREAEFYARVAPHLSMRLPRTIAVIDRDEGNALLIMQDLIASGAHFCSALEPFTPETVCQTLDQIARLHATSSLLEGNDWIPSRLAYLATAPHFTMAKIQSLLDDPRGTGLAARTRDAGLLLEGMKRLHARFVDRPMTLVHGDCHAGNFYLTPQGPGLTDWQLIQRGHWALDVAYHIAAVLPDDVAAREERALVQHYLDRVRVHGGDAPTLEDVWDDYRAAQIYGFYHWAITTRVDPAITEAFVRRLGRGIERHDTYALLGL